SGIIWVQAIYAESDNIPQTPYPILYAPSLLPPNFPLPHIPPERDYFYLKSLLPSTVHPPFYMPYEGIIPQSEEALKTVSDEEALKKMSKDDLFRMVFNKEPPLRARDYIVRLFVDEIDFGEIQILHKEDFSAFDFYSFPFSHYLDTLLSEDGRLKTNGLDGHFNSLRMDSLNFALNLDDMNYELRVYVPPELKKMQHTMLRSESFKRGQLAKPAKFSFYVNMEAMQQFYCMEYLKKKDTELTLSEWMNDLSGCNRIPVSLGLNGAAAAKGWVLEGYGNIREPQQGQSFTRDNIKRGDFRLVHDMYSSLARLQLGDINPASYGLTGGETMGGARYERNERFFANNPADDRYKINFTLARPAQVEIHINGRVARRLYLHAGQHELNGISGQQGVNSVQVFITQEDGSFMAIPYEFELGNSRNLLKGESRYSVSSGFRRSPGLESDKYSVNLVDHNYHFNEPGFSASYLYGLYPFLSTGISGQASLSNIAVSPQILLNADSVSWWELNALANYADSSKFGYGAGLRYNRRIDKINFLLDGRYQSEAYNPGLFKSYASPSTEYFVLSGKASFRVLRGGISANAGLSLNRKDEKDSIHYLLNYRYGADLSQSIYGISFRTGMEAIVKKGEFEPFVYFNASYSFGMDRHNFAFANELARRPVYVPPVYDIEMLYDELNAPTEFSINETPGHTKYEWKNHSNLSWNYTTGGVGNGFRNYSAGLGMYDDFNSRVSAQHSYNRAQIFANYNIIDFDMEYSNIRNHFVHASGGVSFMFADGLWAFGRPVSNGFMLADVQNGLKGSTVHVNYSEFFKNEYSKSGWLGAAYYNQISNYRPNEIRVSLTNMPLGSWLEQDIYYSMGAYKQGYAVRLGNVASVLMQARLVNENGESMPYV
ncbi:MAG: hypothetical protein FWH22_11695, partial [Fibromonadales bacterium]|nr:hypothetical protein [Fibromonadales bacterium]